MRFISHTSSWVIGRGGAASATVASPAQTASSMHRNGTARSAWGQDLHRMGTRSAMTMKFGPTFAGPGGAVYRPGIL